MLTTDTTKTTTGFLNNLGSVNVDVNVTLLSALYVCMAIIIPIAFYFLLKTSYK